MGPRRPAWEEALEALATIVLAHVPVDGLDFRSKAIFVATMTRRVLMAMDDEKMVDDRDYVGNKRLELSVHLVALRVVFRLTIYQGRSTPRAFVRRSLQDIQLESQIRDRQSTEEAVSNQRVRCLQYYAIPRRSSHVWLRACNFHRELVTQAVQDGACRRDPRSQSSEFHRGTGHDDPNLISIREDAEGQRSASVAAQSMGYAVPQ